MPCLYIIKRNHTPTGDTVAAFIYDVVIIGAGPAGSVAAALLNKQGFNVCVLEKQHFPRFVIGESLLPYAMDVLDEAGLLHAVREAMLGFQYKNGFAFSWGDRYTSFNFLDKFSAGHNFAFNVQRADFDKLLIDEAEKRGVAVRYGETVKRFDNEGDTVMLAVEREDGTVYDMEARFVLDASGFYRALPRLMNWELPPQTVIRQVHFTHIDDRITSPKFDRNKNLVCIHPEHRDIWVWLIPFANGRSSIGVVGEEHYFRHESTAAILKGIVAEIPFLAEILADAEWDNGFPFRYLPGYTTKGKGLYGRHFALLGASGEFLDPVFSSGVTIAVQSAKLAAACVAKELRGQRPDWKNEFAVPLMSGVTAFGSYIQGWYDGRFQDLVFDVDKNSDTGRMVCAILAGYAWDKENPFVRESQILFG